MRRQTKITILFSIILFTSKDLLAEGIRLKFNLWYQLCYQKNEEITCGASTPKPISTKMTLKPMTSQCNQIDIFQNLTTVDSDCVTISRKIKESDSHIEINSSIGIIDYSTGRILEVDLFVDKELILNFTSEIRYNVNPTTIEGQYTPFTSETGGYSGFIPVLKIWSIDPDTT